MAWPMQVATWTSNNRYPGIFRSVQSRVRQKHGRDLGAGRLKVLSFGCSTGNELAALRGYFPEALIYGCDVNQQALAEARQSLRFDEAQIFESSPDNIARFGPYDVIFAMSVMCRFPESQNPKLCNLRSVYPYDSFEEGVSLLASCLSNAGILCMFNTNYEFPQLALSQSFRALTSPFIANNGFVDRFGRDGERVSFCETLGPYYVHRPRGNVELGSQLDFLNCIFEKRIDDAGQQFVGEDEDRPMVEVYAAVEPPDFFQFGPDLKYCAERRLRASALGYWFREDGERLTLKRAWFRSTFEGRVEQGRCWSVDVDPNNGRLRKIDTHAVSDVVVGGHTASRRVLDKFRRIAGRFRYGNQYLFRESR